MPENVTTTPQNVTATTPYTTTTGNVTAATTQPAPPRETLGQRVGDFFHRADADVQALIARAPGIEADITSHAGEVFSVASEVVNLLGLLDPQAAPVVAAGDVVLAKVLSMVQSAVAIAVKVTPPATGKAS